VQKTFLINMRVFSCPGAVVLAVDIAAEMEPGLIREKYKI
jgi:hypothetical protein